MDQVTAEAMKSIPFAVLFFWLLKYVLDTTKVREERLMQHHERTLEVTEKLTNKIENLGNNLTTLEGKVDVVWCELKKVKETS